ncbi:MAG: penicillin-insensitive murein endopeptidase [Methylocystis sp.]|nr:penicillin-insensitive murein endopeptidase [Methylocystis sp.]MCA3583310.1 penicillin-insensitive murein endopeptidase [Methylocystis sp.]MCA3588095.1 penicillin-insensitive murein endopeptidase [Methylocystis sp.]MCA3591463.1 penicillin-insensitive murein endopeptidase [Methylocystis sp.]
MVFLTGLFMQVTLTAAPFTATAIAQATQTEEMERRANVLRSLPEWAAKRQFGSQKTYAPMEARAIGSYARGCLAGAAALPEDGNHWQVMRLSRNRMWGHPDLIRYLESFARQAAREAGWSGILVGDISQPRGGPMLTGHASHQIGLDADVWLTPMPARKLSTAERENMSAVNMARPDWMDVDPAVWTPNHTKIIRLAARDERVHRIFVNPAIKKALCREAGNDRAWLRSVRPIWGHNYHFHIRMGCPAGMAGCEQQDEPPEGDGCGQELTDWLARQQKAIFGPKPPPGPPRPPPPPLSVDALPPLCREVLRAR